VKVRLLKRLAADRTVSIRVRIWLGVLLVYLVSPIDLIPDFIPVLGYADDALVVAIALRFAFRRAGRDSVEGHWPGTPEGLAAILRLAGLPASCLVSEVLAAVLHCGRRRDLWRPDEARRSRAHREILPRRAEGTHQMAAV